MEGGRGGRNGEVCLHARMCMSDIYNLPNIEQILYISSASDDPGNSGRKVYNSANIPTVWSVGKNKNNEKSADGTMRGERKNRREKKGKYKERKKDRI